MFDLIRVLPSIILNEPFNNTTSLLIEKHSVNVMKGKATILKTSFA